MSRANAVQAGLANVTMHELDMAKVPLPDAYADIVISNGAINLLPDKTCALREAFRVLKLGGRIHIAEIGFVRGECVKITGYRTSASTIGALFFAKKPSK